jgi:cytochrome c biogenesis protein CcdA
LELILKRIKHSILLLTILSAIPALAEKPKGGRLVVEGEYRVSLGDFPAEQSKTVAFKLKNVGDAPIGIMSVSRACGCADAFLTTNVVDKGASVGITFKTYPDKLPGTFVKTFYVITDSPDSRTKLVQLVVTGNGVVTKGKRGASSAAVTTNAWASSNLLTQASQPARPPPLHSGVGQLQQDLRLDVEFFVQEGCAECLVLRRDYLPALASRYAYRIRTVVSDTHNISTFLRLLEKLEACGIKANEPVYMVVGGEKVLSGWGEIAKRGFILIDAALSGPLKADPPGAGVSGSTSKTQTAGTEKNAAARLFRRFGWPAVAIAGLADGLNPCAFATIVFLTSILASGGRRGRAVFMGGLAFCVASFVTYFLIGFGLLSALRRLEGLAMLRFIVEWGTVAALMILGALSLLDAWRYSRTGDAGSVRLQLPGSVKRRIRLFARARWGGAAVFGTGLLCGAGVTLLESVCTGQMYLPTLVFMSREGGGCRAWGMLLLYNVLFVVPLFAVFMMGAFGVRSQRLAALTRRHVVPSKILLSVVFFALAAFLLTYALEHG